MSTSITTRQTAGTGATVKGSPLTNTEVDNNFIGLNQAVQPTGGTAGQILAKIDATNFNSQWIDNYATQVKLQVKNATGSTINKGAVVYISGATGANALISLAQANGDSTSATTVGFLESTLATGDSGLAVVTGVIAGIDTSLATEGDPVWLSPTTAGGVVYGLANKPQAPNHLVYLGTVTRAHATVGEIQVHISNGWEIEELHDVKITSKANNDIIQYDSTLGVWKNVTPATARTNLGLAIGTNVQAWDADLDAIAGLAGTSGLLKKTAANTWSLDTNTYLTGNQSITVSGDATGSGTTAITLTLSSSGVSAGTYTKVTVDAKGRVTTGASLSSSDVTTALGYTPYNSTNPSGYITSASVGNGTLTLAVSGTGLSGSASFTANQSGNATFTVTSNATSANTASTIVARDASGNFSAGTITATLSGNASSATNATYATSAGSATNATSASSATNATYATSAGSASSATNATYATSAGSATNAGYATSAGSATNATTASNANALASFSANAYNTQNLRLYGQSTGAVGILGVDSGGTFRYQIYGDGSSYGFLNGAWAGWDLRKANNGELYVTVSGTERTVITSGTIGSQSVASATNATYATSAGSASSATNASYATNAGYASAAPASGISGQTGMWTSSARPGPYRLYRNDDNSAYNVQTTWSADVSGYWSLRGYLNDSYHAPCYVAYSGYASSAGSATNASYASSAGSATNASAATNATYATSAGSATNATYASTAGALTTGNNYQVNSLGVGTAASGTAGEIRATNNVTAYYSSDAKFKENITDIPGATEIVLAIGGKLFDWTDEYLAEHGGADGYFVRKQDFGVIAQDVLRVFPRAVRVRSDGSLAVDYEKLCALAFAATAEQDTRIRRLESLIAKLIGD